MFLQVFGLFERGEDRLLIRVLSVLGWYVVMLREVLVITIASIDNTQETGLVMMTLKMTMYLVVYEHSFTLSVPLLALSYSLLFFIG